MDITRTLLILFFVCLSAFAESQVVPPPLVNTGADDIMLRVENGLKDLTTNKDTLTTLAGEMAKYKIPGLGLAIIDENKVVSERYYGKTVIDGNNPVNPNTLFEAASVSKMVTAVIVLKLAQVGKIDLNADINNYLKSWRVPVNNFSAETPITIQQVLIHCAGFNRPETGFGFIKGKSGTLTDLLRGVPPASNPPLKFENRSGVWNYSNFGYIVLQLLIEDISGRPFQSVADELVLKPLGMHNSTFRFPLSEEQLSVKAYSHSAKGLSFQHGLQEVAVAQGGLVTTPADMAKLVIELMLSFNGKSDKLLTMDYSRKMISGYVALDPALLGGIDVSMGYGLLVRGKDNNTCFLMAGQNMPGATCFIIGFPGSGQGAVVMTNCESGELVQLELIMSAGKAFDWPSSRL